MPVDAKRAALIREYWRCYARDWKSEYGDVFNVAVRPKIVATSWTDDVTMPANIDILTFKRHQNGKHGKITCEGVEVDWW